MLSPAKPAGECTTPGLSGGGAEHHYASTYWFINVLLRDNALSGELQAAMYRALALIPRVTLVTGTVDAEGRPAVALNRVRQGWLHEQVLLNSRTYRYLGERAGAVCGHRAQGDDISVVIRAGTLQRLLVRWTPRSSTSPANALDRHGLRNSCRRRPSRLALQAA
jgi:hypothetical protein